METSTPHILNNTVSYSKFVGFVKLSKLRLGWLVVFSAVITYFTVATSVNWLHIFALSIGGVLVTSAANGFNQIIESDLDKLMDRTKLRPMPLQILSHSEA